MRGTRLRRLLAAGLAALVPLVLTAAPAAARAPDQPVAVAEYRGEVFDLSKGWRGAQACVVLSAAKVTCYATVAEADASLGYKASADPAVLSAAAPSCSSGWLCLYSDPGGQGRRLQFRDEYWQYLSAYAFENQTSSWRNAQGAGDAGWLSLNGRSTPYQLIPQAYANSMGSMDNQAYAVWG